MKHRILGYDLARALAVFGMVIVNYEIVMGASQAGNHWALSIAHLFHGRAAATFVTLAGVGVTLLSRGCQHDRVALGEARRALLKRAGFLFVVGLAYTPIWPADILHFYGVYLLIATVVVAAPMRDLVVAVAVLILGSVVLLFLLDYERGWDFATLTYADLWTPAGMARHLAFNGFHPVFPWAAFLLFGMSLGRLDMTDAQVRRQVLFWGVVAVVLAEATSRLLIAGTTPGLPATEAEDLRALFGTEPMPPVPLFMLAGGGTAALVIAACVTVTERWPHARALRPLVHTGQLALTAYVAHVLLGMGVLEALGRLENQSALFSLASASTFCALAVFFAHLWRRRFARGPLETLMRHITG